jgi:hypothetical protein
MKTIRSRVEALEAPQANQEIDIALAIANARKKPRLLQTPEEIALMRASKDPQIRAIASARKRAGLIATNA